MKKAILLDRDGTIIVDKIYLNDPDQIEYLPGAFEALQLLRDLGFAFAVCTNQSGVPRGLVQVENLNEIHRRIKFEFHRYEVDILGFYSAPFMTDTDHPMRKPNPGMLLQAASDHNLDLGQSWMMGDKVTDVLAGQKVNCQTGLIGPSGIGENELEIPATLHEESLLEIAKKIVNSSK